MVLERGPGCGEGPKDDYLLANLALVLVLRGLEGRGYPSSLSQCPHLSMKAISRMETSKRLADLGLQCLHLPLGSLSEIGIRFTPGTCLGGVPMLPLKTWVQDRGIHTPLLWLSPGEGELPATLTLLSSLTCIQKVAYTTVLQEWLRLACRSDAHPELVRRHLVTFRAMSSRLLDYVVNIADSNGNTALHYSVSHANFPVVRQLLDSGRPSRAGRRAWGSGPAATSVWWSDGGDASPPYSPRILERAAMILWRTCSPSTVYMDPCIMESHLRNPRLRDRQSEAWKEAVVLSSTGKCFPFPGLPGKTQTPSLMKEVEPTI